MSLHVDLGKEEWQYVRAILTRHEKVEKPKPMRTRIIAKIDDVIGEES